jgi:alkylation response protein AidB-like acyl-CoA dehydrogenase
MGAGLAVSLSATCNVFSGPVAALCAGICGGSLKKAVAYVKERRQGGRMLAEYSQVQMMIAGMASRYEKARVAAERLSESGGLRDAEDIALFISARDGVARAVQDGVQLLGGYGYMEDYGQERCMRDAKQAQMMLGRDDLRRLDMAALHLE